MNNFVRELSVAVDLARKAGKVVMEVYATNFSVSYKGACLLYTSDAADE